MGLRFSYRRSFASGKRAAGQRSFTTLALALLAIVPLGTARFTAVSSDPLLLLDPGLIGSISAPTGDRSTNDPLQFSASELQELQRRFGVRSVTVIHRVGPLSMQDQIVLVALSAAHRGEAFQACECLMDFLKTRAPFWKKEQTPEGARWVDARVTDDAALAKWGIVASNA